MGAFAYQLENGAAASATFDWLRVREIINQEEVPDFDPLCKRRGRPMKRKGSSSTWPGRRGRTLTHDIDLTNLAPGAYFLHAFTDDRRLGSQRVVVQR